MQHSFIVLKQLFVPSWLFGWLGLLVAAYVANTLHAEQNPHKNLKCPANTPLNVAFAPTFASFTFLHLLLFLCLLHLLLRILLYIPLRILYVPSLLLARSKIFALTHKKVILFFAKD
ncbi:hypothetical protein HFN_1495 [Helicobacter fennelliae MRY12-0050]|uniref:Uncharacterized protein n=1 Tax=Helicobacter fennelliae MRY12-0050 TaxID=1325130 RepID=T1CYB3_9HELI|nr:hypothetical protein HFN_1495 [Helicobacter fennelliae MRY12-0050]